MKWTTWGLMLLVLVQLGAASRPINQLYQQPVVVYDELAGLVAAHNGQVSVVGLSWEGRPIKAYSFGHGPVFMFDGLVHGPEDCGTQAGLDFLRWALEDQGEESRRVREGVQLVFIPFINVDGPTSRVNSRGVNINRNFPQGWGASGSRDPSSWDYIGPGPASEKETRAVLEAVRLFDPRVYFNVHCGMQLASGGGSVSLSQGIMRKMQSRPGYAQAFVAYRPHYSASCGVGGYVKAGACDSNTSSWLLELATWERLPVSLEGFKDTFGPAYLPIYQAAALSIAAPLPALSLKNQTNTTRPAVNSTVPKNPPPVVLVNKTLPANKTLANKTENKTLPPPAVVHVLKRQPVPLEMLGFRSWLLLWRT